MTPIKGVVITLTTDITPEQQFRAFVSAAKTAAEASRMVVCAVTAYLLNVNYFRTAKDEDYLSKAAAVDYMKAQLPKHDIKGGMLDIYVSRGADVYSRITATGSKFKPLIQELVKLKDPDKVVARLFKWMDGEVGWKSLKDISVSLGYSTGKTATGGEKGKKTAPATKVENLGTSVANVIEKVVGDNKNKVTNTQVNQVIAKKVGDPLDLAMQGIREYAARPDADPDKLHSIIKLVEKVVDQLIERQKAQKARVAKLKKATPGKSKEFYAAQVKKEGAPAQSAAVHSPSI